MRLNRRGREVYSVSVTLIPAASGTWQASFDNGVNFVNGTDQGNGSFGWLVAGPGNSGGSPDYQWPADGPSSLTPLLMLVVGSEQVVVRGPSIDLD